MTKVIAAHSCSLDGFIAGANDSLELPLGEGGTQLFSWFSAGEVESRVYPWMRLSPESAAHFDAVASHVGAVVSGRRTYDLSRGWGGDGPLPGAALFVLTHEPPEPPPRTTVPYTFVTDGVEAAVEAARVAAAGRDVSLMGTSAVQQCLRSGLLDELFIDLVPVVLGVGARLLDHLSVGTCELELAGVLDAPGVTHLRYLVRY